MNEHKDEKWLDEQLQRAVNGATPAFDAQAWKDKYAREYQMLITRRKRAVGWGLPHHGRLRILMGPFGKFAIAAAIIVAAGVLLAGRLGPKPPTPGPQPVVQEAPAQMVSMISLSAAFRQGGMEGLDKQCERALERLGPRSTGVSMQALLKDISGKG